MFVKKMMVLKGEIMGVCKLERLGEQWKCHIRLNDSYFCGDATVMIDKPNCEIGAITNGKAMFEMGYLGEIDCVVCYIYDDGGRVISYGNTGATVDMASCESYAREAWETRKKEKTASMTQHEDVVATKKDVQPFDIGYAQQEQLTRNDKTDINNASIGKAQCRDKKRNQQSDSIISSNVKCGEIRNLVKECDDSDNKDSYRDDAVTDRTEKEIYGGSILGSAMLIDGEGSEGEQGIECDDISRQPFYLKVEDRLQELFHNYPHDSELEGLVHYSRWVRVEYEERNFYVVGLVEEDNVPLFICYGVPVESKDIVSQEHSPSCEWLPVDRNDVKGRGYWVLYQDAHSGEILT